MCVSLFYVIDTGSIRPRARIRVTELGVTYLPSTFSSDTGYATYPYWEPQSASCDHDFQQEMIVFQRTKHDGFILSIGFVALLGLSIFFSLISGSMRVA